MASQDQSRSPYGFQPELQRAMALKLVGDPVLLPRISTYFKPARLSDECARLIADAALGYYRQYGDVATTTVVLQELRRKSDDGQLSIDRLVDCAAYLDAAMDAPKVESKYLIDRVAEEERQSALWQALDNGLKLYRAKKYDEVVRSIERANLIGKGDLSLGTNQLGSLAARTVERREGKVPPRWGTGIPELDEKIAGGIAAGELGCILGAAKFGKSQCLSYIAQHIASLGGTVVYITLEMGERQIVDRHDASIARVPINSLQFRADEVHTKVGAWFSEVKGAILVKYMSPRETTCREIRAYLQQLRVQHSIEPTMLLVDYGDLLGAVSSDFDKRHEELGVVYTELRALLGDFGIPGWTASQANKEALSAKVVSAANVAESYKKVAICDVLVAICRTEEERLAKLVRFYVAACRYASDGDVLGPFNTAFEMGRIVADGGAINQED